MDTPDVTASVEDGQFTTERVLWRKQQMKLLCDANHNLTPEESSQLSELLASHHDVFSLKEEERGETSLVEFSIDTGDSTPKKLLRSRQSTEYHMQPDKKSLTN